MCSAKRTPIVAPAIFDGERVVEGPTHLLDK